jgi:GNAT superfamily N-acetyltransferase
MSHDDIPGALALCRASNWNQVADDWRVFLDRGGAFVAVEEGAIVGSVAHLPFGAFTWLSMMLVDPAARRSGIGTRLMETCLDAIGDGFPVRLDATPLGEPLYRRFGFIDEYPLQRTRTEDSGTLCVGARPIAEADLPAIVARDRDVFGADRGTLLADLLSRAPELAWRTESAYCFGRQGHIRPQIGPLVAANAESARQLVAHCHALHPGVVFTIDTPAPSALKVTPERPFLRMLRGAKPHTPHSHPHVFAITGPEFG